MRLKHVVDLDVHILQILIDCFKDNRNTDIILHSLNILYLLTIRHIKKVSNISKLYILKSSGCHYANFDLSFMNSKGNK
jgi:hypothetical protein